MKVIYVGGQGDPLANQALDDLDRIIHDCFTQECDTRMLKGAPGLELLRHTEPDAIFVAVYEESEKVPAWAAQMGYQLVLTEALCDDAERLSAWLLQKHCEFSGYTPPRLGAGSVCYKTKPPYFVTNGGIKSPSGGWGDPG